MARKRPKRPAKKSESAARPRRSTARRKVSTTSARPRARRRAPEVEPTIVVSAGPVLVVTASAAPRLGPLLRNALAGLESGATATGLARLVLDAAPADAPAQPILPVSLSVPRIVPVPGERWPHYKQRVLDILGPVREWMKANAGLECDELVTGNALRTSGLTGQVREAAKDERLKLIELDPPRIVTTMDDAVRDVELPLFRMRHPELDGQGIRVAVLDSGVDIEHPWLSVADSVSTCGEPVNLPGRHGTHVAGSIASRDSVYIGVAPGVTLLNIKVLTAAGGGQPSFITQGVDAALDRTAHILSMSLGFNHLPPWSQGGHGWSCPAGDCVLCTAVNNAVTLEGVIAVVAAGNEHNRAVFLRQNSLGHTFDSEICCPGAATGAITVAALTKQTFLTASFSSHGPTAFQLDKPNIAAPGVNITSSVPVPRQADGSVIADPTRAQLSGRESGTSMATPIVSGAIALLLQRRLAAGQPIDVASVRGELLTMGTQILARPAVEVGVGRLSLGTL